MTESIPPKGMSITAYPPFTKTAEISRIADISNLIVTLEKSIQETKKTIDSSGYLADEIFFMAHYGLNPFEAFMRRHFFETNGSRKKLTTANLRTMATEILAYRNPAPRTLRQDNLIIMLSACNKLLDDREAIAAKRKEIVDIGFDAMVRMSFSPIPEQIKSVYGAGLIQSAKVKSHSPYAWKNSFRSIHNELTKAFKLKPSVTLVTHMKKMGFVYDRRIGDYLHPRGFALTPFLIHHVKSVMDRQDPVGYWSHIARYRLTALRVAEKITEVHLVEVNPATGAPFNKGIVVGVYSDSPASALASVRTMYPHVMELKPSVNPTLDASISISDDSSKLKESAQRWALTGSKEEISFVNIVRTTWNWPDLDLTANQRWYSAFSSKNKANRGNPTPKQQELLNFQSDDARLADAARRAGNPPGEIAHLLYGGDPQQMMNCFPMSRSEFYLLPERTELAFERICLPREDNVVVKYVNKMLSGVEVGKMGYKVGENSFTHPMIAPFDLLEYGKKLKEINNDMQILKAAISSPYLYTLGYSKLLAGNPMENLGMRASLKCRMRVKQIFEDAKWPDKAGEIVFKAPVNDDADIQVMRGKFEDAMRQTGKSAPNELSFFEMPELKIDSKPVILSDGKTVMNYGIVRGAGYPFTAKRETALSPLFRYYDAGTKNASWKTLYIQRNLTFSKGIRSKSKDASQKGSDVFSTMTTLEEEKIPQLPVAGYGSYAETATLAGGAGLAISMLAVGYVAFKRRNPGGNS